METIQTHEKDVKACLYIIRGQQVMLDSDLAKLYGTEVKKLNQQVSRNKDKFPDDFMFQLDKEELPESLKSQYVTLNKTGNSRGQHIKKMPYAFTEQGIYMIATILKNNLATQQSIRIMRTFKELRHYVAENRQLLDNQEILQIGNRLTKQEAEIRDIKTNMATRRDLDKIMNHFIEECKIKEITILNGQVFEAMEAYKSIYQQADYSIYVIDDYINIDTLSLLKYKKANVEVLLFSDNKGAGNQKLHQREIDVFNQEYPVLRLYRNGFIHDRYIVIDYDTKHEKIYHCGASGKDAGKKVCGINALTDRKMVDYIMKKLLNNRSTEGLKMHCK